MTEENTKDVDFDHVKEDAKDLMSNIGAWLGGVKDDAEDAIVDTKNSLKEKQETLSVKAVQLSEAGDDATDDLKEGFKNAYLELKKSFGSAKDKFDKD